MTFTITTVNYLLYFNSSGGDRIVTVAVSSQARLEVKTPNGVSILQQITGGLGGVVSLRVPAQHVIEVDASQTGVQVEVLGSE